MRKLLLLALLLPALALGQNNNQWTQSVAGSGSGGGGSGTVTSVGFTGGLISVANPTTTPAFTVAGTSGGIPYFSSTSTWASSAALTANALVIGGGAGTAPSTATTGTGVLTALGVNTGSAGAFVVNGGTASININGTVGATTPAAGTFTSVTDSGLTSGRVTFASTAGLLADTASLVYDATNGPCLTVGSGNTTLAGWRIGCNITAFAGGGFPSLWDTTVTASASNFTLQSSAGNTTLNATGNLDLRIGNVTKLRVFSSAGTGIVVTSGTATAAGIAAMSLTRTNNNALVDTGVLWTFTDTTSAAGFLPFQILGTSSGTVNLFKVSKAGVPYGGASTFLIGSTATLANGAAAQIATMTNGPTAGNPTKWVPFDDNGTTRYFPAW